MAIGKSKKLGKGGKKGGKKKVIDPMTRKEWYSFRAPMPFETKNLGYTPVTRTTGTKIASESLIGRVLEVSLADLKKQSDQLAWRKIKLVVEDVDGKTLKTSFYGMDLNRDKLCQFIKKRQTLIESFVDVKTADGYLLRVFVVGFTRSVPGQICKTSYAKSSQIKAIRKKMIDIITKEANSSNITEFVKKLITEVVVEKISKECFKVYPLNNVCVRKVKMLKKVALDAVKLDELYKGQGVAEENTKGMENVEQSENLLHK